MVKISETRHLIKHEAFEDLTGESVRRGSITRYGDSRLRNKMIQGAWSAIRKDPELKKFYERIYQQRPKDKAAKIAIVAVARKMANRIYAVLHQEKNYEIRHPISSQPLTQEETFAPGNDSTDGRAKGIKISLDGSFFRQRSRGILSQANSGLLAQQKLTKPGNALEGTY